MSDWGQRIAPGIVRFERLLPGSIEEVWGYLVIGEKRRLWLAGGDDVPMQAGAEFELHFHHASLSSEIVPAPERFRPMEGGVTSRHRVLAVEPPRLLVISWGGGEGEAQSEARFALKQEGEQTRLTLTHSLLSPHAEPNVAGGWHTHLDILADRMQGREPEPFWTRFEPIEAHYKARILEPFTI